MFEKKSPAAQVGDGVAQLSDAAARLHIQDLTCQTVGDKLVVHGRARYQLDCDLLWDAIKDIDGWEVDDVLLDISVERRDIRGYHTVARGETLADIAERYLGSASRDLAIFDANRDRMNDPDQISPGQQLLIPRR